MTEFNLSEKIQNWMKTTNCIGIEQTHNFVYIDDVKEFIRLLKEDINQTLEEGITRNEILPKDWAMDRINNIIDKLAGNSLTARDKLI